MRGGSGSPGGSVAGRDWFTTVSTLLASGRLTTGRPGQLFMAPKRQIADITSAINTITLARFITTSPHTLSIKTVSHRRAQRTQRNHYVLRRPAVCSVGIHP